MSSEIEGFRREADQLREVMDAKVDNVWTAINGIRNVLERLTASYEKQAEQNTQLALMGNTIQHFQETFVENREKVHASINNHEDRITKLERRAALKDWLGAGFWTVLVAVITALGAIFGPNFETVLKIIGVS